MKHPDRRAYQRQWYRKNREKRLAQCRLYNSTHKEQKRLWTREWRRRHPDLAKAADVRYRKRHRDLCRARSRAWGRKNKDYERIRKQRQRLHWSDRQKKAHRDLCKKYYRENPLKYFEAVKQRRAVVAGVTVDPAGILEWKQGVMRRRRIYCSYCQRSIPKTNRQVHFDHIVPIARGGAHALYNLCVACQTCNLSKGTKLLSEWKPHEQVHQSC